MLHRLTQISTIAKLGLSFCLLIGLLVPAFVAFAQDECSEYMSPEQRAGYESGILNYDYCELQPPEPAPSTGGGGPGEPLEGCNGVEQAWNFLKGQGLEDAQAAGIIGNLRVESGDGIDPNASNRGNYRGIAQWSSPGRWDTLVAWVGDNPGPDNNRDPLDRGNQLRYLWYEAGTPARRNDQQGRTNIEGLQQQPDFQHATWYWGRYFEVAIIGGSTSHTPLTNVQALTERTNRAQNTLTRASTGDWSCD